MTTGGNWQTPEGSDEANAATGPGVPPPPAPPEQPMWNTLPAEPAPYGQQQATPGYPAQPAAPQPYAQQAYPQQPPAPQYAQQPAPQAAPQYGAAPGIENYSAPGQPAPAAYSYGYGTPTPYGGNPTAKNWMGIVGLVSWFVGLSLVSIILGHLGRSAAKRGEATNGGVALASLILGYIQLLVVALGLIFAVLIPVIATTTDVTAQDDWIVVDDTATGVDDPADEVVGDVSGVTNVDANSLVAGMCFLDPSTAATLDENNELVYYDYPVVDCSQPHFGEVYLQTTSTMSSFDADALQIDAENQCIDEGYEQYVGVAYEDSIYYASYYAPTEESWNFGDRGITCAIVDYDSALVGSVAGSAQ